MARIKMYLASAKAPWLLSGCLSDAVGGRSAGLYNFPASARDSAYIEVTWKTRRVARGRESGGTNYASLGRAAVSKSVCLFCLPMTRPFSND